MEWTHIIWTLEYWWLYLIPWSDFSSEYAFPGVSFHFIWPPLTLEASHLQSNKFAGFGVFEMTTFASNFTHIFVDVAEQWQSGINTSSSLSFESFGVPVKWPLHVHWTLIFSKANAFQNPYWCLLMIGLGVVLPKLQYWRLSQLRSLLSNQFNWMTEGFEHCLWHSLNIFEVQ